jgi:hypothetical protein
MARTSAPCAVLAMLKGAFPLPTVDLVIGYNKANTSPLLNFILRKVDDLKFRVTKSGSR